MDKFEIWSLIVALAFATLATKGLFIGLWSHFDLPPILKQGLRYVSPAVFAAIIAPQLLTPVATGGHLDPFRVLVAVFAFAVAWVTRSTMLTVVLGMAAFWGGGALQV